MKTKSNQKKIVPIQSNSATLQTNKEEKKSIRYKNNVILTGQIANDPVLLDTKNGGKKAFCMLDTDGTIQQTETEKNKIPLWHSIVGWGSLAEKFAGEVRNGDKVSVAGRIHVRPYKDKNGISKLYTEVILQNFEKINL
jgi:single-strand DNA-binding protein